VLVRVVVLALLASATITAVAPNPATDGDAGEFVVVEFAGPTNTTGWTLADEHTEASLPNRTLSGVVAFSTAPAAARNRTDHRVVGLSGDLSLSNAGERVELRADGVSEIPHGVDVGEVGADEPRLRSHPPKLLGEGLSGRLVAAVDDHVRAQPGERAGRLPPDAARRPRDERRGIREIHVSDAGLRLRWSCHRSTLGTGG